MNRLILASLGAITGSLIIAAPAYAQHTGHTMPKPAPKPTPTPAPTPSSTEDAMSTMDMRGAAGPAKAARMPAGHDMSSMATPPAAPATDKPAQTMPAGHDMSAMDSGKTKPEAQDVAGTDLAPGNAPAPPPPEDHAADAAYGPEAMQMGRRHLAEFHGGQKLFQAIVNIAEAQIRNGRDGYEWDGEAWYGGDIDRLWLKSEGAGEFGVPAERIEAQALYSRAIGPYFNLQGGLRYDFAPDPSRVFATIGIEGLAPGFFDVEAALFLSNKGELLGRLEGYYDQRITQRLILQPRAELDFAAQSTPELGTGSGLSSAELGLRLRYDIRREFAPYLGVQYSRAFGDTRRFMEARDQDPSGWSFVTGIRFWF